MSCAIWRHLAECLSSTICLLCRSINTSVFSPLENSLNLWGINLIGGSKIKLLFFFLIFFSFHISKRHFSANLEYCASETSFSVFLSKVTFCSSNSCWLHFEEEFWRLLSRLCYSATEHFLDGLSKYFLASSQIWWFLGEPGSLGEMLFEHKHEHVQVETGHVWILTLPLIFLRKIKYSLPTQ